MRGSPSWSAGSSTECGRSPPSWASTPIWSTCRLASTGGRTLAAGRHPGVHDDCGHGVVSPHLVKDMIRRVKTGKVSEWDGSVLLAEPCACGITTPAAPRNCSGKRRHSTRLTAGSAGGKT